MGARPSPWLWQRASEPQVLATGQRQPTSPAADEAHVYWSNAGSAARDYADGQIMKIPVGGGVPTVVADAQHFPVGVALDATHVYWVTSGSGMVMRALK